MFSTWKSPIPPNFTPRHSEIIHACFQQNIPRVCFFFQIIPKAEQKRGSLNWYSANTVHTYTCLNFLSNNYKLRRACLNIFQYKCTTKNKTKKRQIRQMFLLFRQYLLIFFLLHNWWRQFSKLVNSEKCPRIQDGCLLRIRMVSSCFKVVAAVGAPVARVQSTALFFSLPKSLILKVSFKKIKCKLRKGTKRKSGI